MKNQLIPHPDLAPPSVKHLPTEKKIELWAKLVDESESLLIASLKARLGPDGDWKAAYRDWYRRTMEDHDRMQIHLAENLARRERSDAR